ncbi:sugar phosphate isomerase/epimerase family protein [Zobellia uliginosa]|uniref:sugar phosphate isomerase/epimerase family protein n=1 Tax=Zobellia uliginosa TaxID=143224 RepID=UPI001C07A08B|nr:sugar phosphate isomerase/epimerase [Zobellia uliginosa]MBU2947431.1 sugar phosphate isomerase/epimerase [Zobellia uliginosa]
MAPYKAQTSRRNFLRKSSSAALVVPLLPLVNPFEVASGVMSTGLEVYLFSKHLQFLDYEEMAKVASEIGFDGLDLTVRPKGHVLPENVERDLPKAVKAIKKYGLQQKMLTTNVLDVKNDADMHVLETASSLGMTHYRTGWLIYPEGQTIEESQEIYRELFRNLEIVNKELNLIGCYQNHAGNHVGAPIWDLPPILPSKESESLGAQYDIRHAVVEGGMSWELNFRFIAPYIRSIVIKDFKWGMKKGKWKPINTPLGEGMVNFDRYFSLLKKYRINVPVSLHLEYDLGGAEHGATEITIDKEEVYAKMKKDLIFLRETWNNAE